MNLKDEFLKIDKFFDSMSIKELENMLIKNGAMDNKCKLDQDTDFSYRNNIYDKKKIL